jgi:hypothetical protein
MRISPSLLAKRRKKGEPPHMLRNDQSITPGRPERILLYRFDLETLSVNIREYLKGDVCKSSFYEPRWSETERSPKKPGSRSLRSFQKTASVEANGKIIARS